MDMKLYKVLKTPHITEQSSQLNQDLKQIVFRVDKGANKREIKKAVELSLIHISEPTRP